MAIWDNFSKIASETTTKAIQQARILSETTRLSGLISDEERVISDTYLKIGKMYFTLHHNDYEPAFDDLISTVVASEQKIKQYRMQIQDIKGVVRCEKCGAEVTKGAAFCSSCGAEISVLDISAIESQNRCGNCGALIDADMRFCTSCGKPIASAVAVEGMQPDAEDEPDANHVCPSCGAAVDSHAAFCTECGSKIGEGGTL